MREQIHAILDRKRFQSTAICSNIMLAMRRQDAIFLGLLVLPAVPAVAQVRLDLRALDQLSPTPAVLAPIPPPPLPASPLSPPWLGPLLLPPALPGPGVAPRPPLAMAASRTPLAARLPPLPQAAPPLPAVLASPIPAALPPTAAAAAVARSERPQATVAFAPGQRRLSAAARGALARFAHTVRRGRVFVIAYAAIEADDPSSARRLALARGLAVRRALIEARVDAARILLRVQATARASALADVVALFVPAVLAPSPGTVP